MIFHLSCLFYTTPQKQQSSKINPKLTRSQIPQQYPRALGIKESINAIIADATVPNNTTISKYINKRFL